MFVPRHGNGIQVSLDDLQPHEAVFNRLLGKIDQHSGIPGLVVQFFKFGARLFNILQPAIGAFVGFERSFDLAFIEDRVPFDHKRRDLELNFLAISLGEHPSRRCFVRPLRPGLYRLVRGRQEAQAQHRENNSKEPARLSHAASLLAYCAPRAWL